MAAAALAQTGAQDGAIEGSVRDAMTKAPVAGAAIEATGPEAARSTVSDAKGEFRFEHLTPGSYRLKYTLQGYLGSDASGARQVTVKSAGSAEPLVLRMTPVARLEGVVVDEEGHPMPGVGVYTDGSHQATTGADGRYAIERLQPGTYRLVLRTPYEARRKTLKRDERTGEVFGYANTEFYPGVADAQASSPVSVSGGLDLRGFDIRLRRVRLVEFSGRAVEGAGGEPVAGARVELAVNGAAAPLLLDDTFKDRPVGDDGGFRFDLIQPGSYSLLVYRGEGSKALPWTLPVEVGKAGVQDMKVVVPPFPSLQGLVVAPPDTEWAGQVIFRIHATNRAWGSRDFTINSEKFTIDELPPGKWIVMVDSNVLKRPEASKLYIQSAHLGTQNAMAEPLTIVESGNPPFEVRLTAESGRIVGTLLEPNGAPRVGVTVLASRTDIGIGMGFVASSATKDDGRVTLDGLAPGNYQLLVLDPQRADFVRFDPREFPKVEVKAGETSVVRIAPPKQ